MTDVTEAYVFCGRTLIDRDGDKIGKIDDVYEDREGGQPEWVLVSTGLFGTKKTFVPLRDAHPVGDDLRVPIARDRVKGAPHIDADAELGEREEQQLFEHYEMAYTTNGSDVSGPTTDDAMSRSEEELRVGMERREAGRVRLRKYDGDARP
jgi:PRC-barrel domain/Domain of unknown function (DUF2382)